VVGVVGQLRDWSMTTDLTGDTVALLQTLIRNECVNDGTASSGHETRNADVLQSYVEGSGVDIERWEPTPDRASFVARIPGSDPTAPSLCLMGHTDVVPVNADGWHHDPFGGELIRNADGQDEIWGRGAIDMLNLTASMAVVFKSLVDRGFRPKGDLMYFAVADEEAGSAHGARWVADEHPDAIRCKYLLTESGGLHTGGEGQRSVGVIVAEKGVAWRRLRVRGTPGHGSMPFGSDNALVTAATVVSRLAEYRPTPRFHELWRGQVESLGLPDDMKAAMLDENTIDDLLADLPHPGAKGHFHACTHTTFSPNVIDTKGRPKTNVIPDVVDLDIDIRTMPGDDTDEVSAHLRSALGDDLFERIDVEVLMDDPASTSRIDTPLWDALERAVNVPFPDARLNPQFSVGFTDARVFRELGAVSYGAGLFSPEVDPSEYSQRFHGHNERVDIESLRLTTELWERVILDLLG
jgi:acetylornithine deacetylase/succinyl-diaminopimelate desuccinylase-like protein